MASPPPSPGSTDEQPVAVEADDDGDGREDDPFHDARFFDFEDVDEVAETESEWVFQEGKGLRDPFRAYLFDLVTAEGEEGVFEVARTPQESYGLTEFTLLALVTGTPVPRAMLRDPTGFGHVLSPGDPIGREGGRVLDVLPNELRVALPPDSDGKVEVKAFNLHEVDERAQHRLSLITREKDKVAEPVEEKDLEDIDIQELLGSK